MGWGAETFLEDWDEVVKAQNQATLDGSPVAQAIMKFVGDEGEFVGTSSELHNKLKPVAERLGVDRDKAWQKSARWLWRRIKEVLPVLSSAGIEASRERPESGTVIALRETPTDDDSDARQDESGDSKPDGAGNRDGGDASSNARSGPNVSSNASEDSAYLSDADNTGNAGNTYGDFSELVPLLSDRPAWLCNQARKCIQEGSPEPLMKPLPSSIVAEFLGDVRRWGEALSFVEENLEDLV